LFTIEIDDTILDFGNHSQWIEIIGNLKINDKVEMEIYWIDRISWQYRDYKSLYNGEVSNVLLPHRSFDHAIDIQTGKEPPWGPIYTLTKKELSVLKEYMKDMLDQGNLRRSKSPARAPILFVQKPHGRGLQLCLDFQGLNTVTVVKRRPLPMTNEL